MYGPINRWTANVPRNHFRKNDLNKLLVTIVKYGISFCILAWLFWQAWQTNQFSVLWQGKKNYIWLAIALCSGIGVCLVAYYRWYVLGRALDLKFTVLDAIRLGFLGNLLNLLSVGVLGGDAVKAVFLARQEPGRTAEAVASVIFDRAIGLLTMFAFAGTAWWFTEFSTSSAVNAIENKAMNFICQFSMVMSIIGLAGLGVLFLTPRLTRTGFYKRVSRSPGIGGLFRKMVGVGLVYRNRFPAVIQALLLSAIVNLMFATTFYGIAAGLTESHPTFRQHLVISPIAMVANAIPLPGGLGGMEAAVTWFYRAFSSESMPGNNGFVVAIGFRLILLITAAIGLVIYLSRKSEIRELSKSNMT